MFTQQPNLPHVRLGNHLELKSNQLIFLRNNSVRFFSTSKQENNSVFDKLNESIPKR